VKAGRAPPISLQRNSSISVGPQDAQGRHSVSVQKVKRGDDGKRVNDGESLALGTPDLVLIAEGAGSRTRDALGLKSLNTSPDAQYVMGILKTDQPMPRTFQLTRQELTPNGATQPITVRTGAQGFGENAQHYLVAAEVPPHVRLSPEGLKPGTPEYAAAKRTLETAYLREKAAELSGLPKEKVQGYELEWYSPQFSVQQHIANGASSGSNVAMIGDAVGNASFIVGGGMMTATVPHIEAFKRLVHALERGQEPRRALKRYEDDATAASLLWGEKGISEYFPVSAMDYATPYRAAIASWKRGEHPDPLTALEVELSKTLQATRPAARRPGPAPTVVRHTPSLPSSYDLVDGQHA
ncbi:MAG: hypothetical protein ACT4TC_14385, partial [Myxococcaceae bacterium]